MNQAMDAFRTRHSPDGLGPAELARGRNLICRVRLDPDTSTVRREAVDTPLGLSHQDSSSKCLAR